MNTISFKFNEDCRNFKKGQTVKIEINDNGFVWLVGENQCGKSTLLQLMRSKKNSLSKSQSIGNDNTSITIHNLRSFDVEIDGLDKYDHIFYLDAIVDDPTSFEQAASADLFFSNGGMAVSTQSKGQKALVMMSMFMQNIIDTTFFGNGHNLIVFDEVDEGMDAARQTMFVKAVDVFRKKFNADIICVTHSVLPIIMGNMHSVFHLGYQANMDVNEYLSLLTKKKVEINIGELSEQEEIDLLVKVLGGVK